MKLNFPAFAVLLIFNQYHESNASLHHSEMHFTDKEEQVRYLQTTLVQAITSAVSDITSLIDSQQSLAAKYVRLGFHDCVGGCDGCVDLSNADNNGLDIPIESLQPVVGNETYVAAGLSRADIWSLAAITGANYAKPGTSFFFEPKYFNRTNCEDFGTPCFDSEGVETTCTDISGPHRELPLPDLDTEDVLDFFNDEFGFTDDEIVALMGAHTLGTASRANSGFDGSSGWVRNENRLDNEYYAQIVGNGDDLFNAPNWNQRLVDNNGGTPDRFQWDRPQGNEAPLIMLNADIALVRTFGEDLDLETGDVSCRFRNNNACNAAPTLAQMGVYRNSNDVWLTDFKAVFEKMLVHGYTIDSNCTDVTCVSEVIGYDPVESVGVGEGAGNGNGDGGGGGRGDGTGGNANGEGNGNGGGRGNGGGGGGRGNGGEGGRGNGGGDGGGDGGGGQRGNGGEGGRGNGGEGGRGNGVGDGGGRGNGGAGAGGRNSRGNGRRHRHLR